MIYNNNICRFIRVYLLSVVKKPICELKYKAQVRNCLGPNSGLLVFIEHILNNIFFLFINCNRCNCSCCEKESHHTTRLKNKQTNL